MGKVVAHKHAREKSPETKTMVTTMNFKMPGTPDPLVLRAQG